MKHRKMITLVVNLITLLSVIASGFGLFSTSGTGEYAFTSIHGQTVSIYGKGLYALESVSMAAQARAQDFVILAIGVPLLLISLYLARQGLLRGRLLLVGTLGFILYTYASYCFLSMYNSMFLVYVILMSASFFAFILTVLSFDLEQLRTAFLPKLPVKWIGGFLFFLAFVITMMWLGRIVNPLLNDSIPVELEHYSTLVIQALDLGLIVPASVVTGVLIIKRHAYGYLLASIFIFKGITLTTSITAMILGMVRAGEQVSVPELILFPLFNAGMIVFMVILLKNMREPSGGQTV